MLKLSALKLCVNNMLETVQEIIRMYIHKTVAKIDKAITAIDLVINKIIEKHEATKLLCSAFECDSVNDNKDDSFNSRIEILRNFITQISEERKHLLELLSQLDRLTAISTGSPLRYGGKSMVCVTVDELAEQAARLENTERVILSDIDRAHHVLNDVFDGDVNPETTQMLDVVAEYRTAARELKNACHESAGYLKRMRDEYSTCEESLEFGFDGLSATAAAPPPPVQASYSSPVVNYNMGVERISRAEINPSASPDKEKNGFWGLFKRKNQVYTTSEYNSVVPPPCVDSVQFSAVASNRVVPGKYLPINIIMYEDAFRKAVDDIVRSHGENVKESKSGYHDVERNSLIRVVLTSHDVEIEDGEEEQKWNGKYLNFEFVVKIPGDFLGEQILLSATVYINKIIATKLKLILDCEKKSKRNISVTREDVVSAFVSYASQDRNRVASIIQGMKKARPDMDIFFDIESLRSGQRWEEALKNEIESRDVLFLCWSRYARDSKWVDMEWRYALESKGEDCIEPIPIDSPDVCPPPIELQQKHFNDKMLFIIKATMPEACGQPYLVRNKTKECMTVDKPIVRIGKEQKYVDLTIDGNAAISRSHANIISRDGMYYIIDLNSTNHTYVDGHMIPSNVETMIYHGAKIKLADEEF